MITFLLFLIWSPDPEIPFRPREEYVVELKYEMKQRPAKDVNTVDLDSRNVDNRRVLMGEIPYVTVLIKILKLHPEETRFKCVTNMPSNLFNKKAAEGMILRVEMGFVNDVKDHVTASEFNVYSLNKSKDPISRIQLKVLSDGTFLVNDEKRGKF